jgi:hypothetical protein
MTRRHDPVFVDEMDREMEGDGSQPCRQTKNRCRRDCARLRWQFLETSGKKIKNHTVNFSAIRSRDNPLSDLQILRSSSDFPQQAPSNESLSVLFYVLSTFEHQLPFVAQRHR